MKEVTSRTSGLEEQIRDLKNTVNEKERQLREVQDRHEAVVKRLEKSADSEKRNLENQIKQLEERCVPMFLVGRIDHCRLSVRRHDQHPPPASLSCRQCVSCRCSGS